MEQNRFLDQIAEGNEVGIKYCFILGAGASKESGIRTGEELMREWRAYLMDDERGETYIRDCAIEAGIPFEKYAHILDLEQPLKNEDYFILYELRFAGQPRVGAHYLEKEMEEKKPSYGYFRLSMILKNTVNNLVVTTNFDNLIEESFTSMYQAPRPLIVVHERLASFLMDDNTRQRPTVVKVHRDVLFDPLSRQRDMSSLAEEWKEPLRNMLLNYVPIVIGYAGGDHTLMSFLEELPLRNIYWCHLRGKEPNEDIQRIVGFCIERGYLVEIDGFDEILFKIGKRLGIDEANLGDPCKMMQEQTEERCNLYKRSRQRLEEKYLRGSALQQNETDRGLAMQGELMELRRQEEKRDYQEQIEEIEEAKRQRNWGIALDLCNDLLRKTENAELYTIKSGIYLEREEYDRAIKEATEAIRLNSGEAKAYYNRGKAYLESRKLKEALGDMDTAIEQAPDHAEYYEGRAKVYRMYGEYDKAQDDAETALRLEAIDKPKK